MMFRNLISGFNNIKKREFSIITSDGLEILFIPSIFLVRFYYYRSNKHITHNNVRSIYDKDEALMPSTDFYDAQIQFCLIFFFWRSSFYVYDYLISYVFWRRHRRYRWSLWSWHICFHFLRQSNLRSSESICFSSIASLSLSSFATFGNNLNSVWRPIIIIKP